jgi:hypothetical protein
MIFATDGVIFLYIMIALVVLLHKESATKLEILPREGFCTCRGMQYNNSDADSTQNNCYKNEIPDKVWDKAHAGCVSVDELPEFAGV